MKPLTLLCSVMLYLVHATPTQAVQSDLSGTYSAEFLQSAIVEPQDWVPYPTAQQAEEWRQRLPAVKYAALIENAEQYLDYEWPVARATEFLEYVRTGNRRNFEGIQFARRVALIALVMGEIVEGEGRFVDDIANGIWAISEESFWGVPAHLGLQEKGHGLPDVDDPVVALFAAQTAQILAWTSYLLSDALDGVHPMVRERIYIEIDRRIFKVIENRPTYRWTGAPQDLDDPTLSYARRSFLQRRPNNWNPWISSNLLTCILLLEQDKKRRAEFVHQVLGYLDKYLDPHPADGGSDEGTGYWGHAAASTFDSFDLVTLATKGAFDEFDQPLIVNMGEFITKAYVGNGYYVNFADAQPRRHHSPMLVYRFGKAVGSEAMMAMGAHLAALTDFESAVPDDRALLRNLPELFYTTELLAVEAVEPLLADSWLPDIQVVFSRDRAGTVEGLYLAAKAGHNEESHNHNDVGSFLVYKNGHPAIIDIGSATYTASYGSEWVRDSAYHNLAPIIDGQVQLRGRKYSARNVGFERAGDKIVFSQDFAPAYGEEVSLEKWERRYTHDKGRSIKIEDRFAFAGQPGSVSLPMMFHRQPVITAPGKVRIDVAAGTRLDVTYDAGRFDTVIEKIEVEDKKVYERWGGNLFRLNFVMREPARSGEYTFLIE